MTFPNPFAAVQQSYRKREAQRLRKKNDKAKVKEWLEVTAQHRHEQWVDDELEPYLLTGTLHLVDTDTSVGSDNGASHHDTSKYAEYPPNSPKLCE